MKQPWATLFHGYDDHWLFSKYMTGDEPDWDGLLNDPKLDGLSSGEKVLLDAACSMKGPWTILDRPHRTRIAMALLDMP